MAINGIKQMWEFLDTHTLTADGRERAVNHLNEWGGFSRTLNMPVFTAWSDHVTYDKDTKKTKALVCDASWVSAVGVNNQEHWLSYAEKASNSVAAFFVIHAVNTNASPRQVKSIDVGRAFIGEIVRDGALTYILGQPKNI